MAPSVASRRLMLVLVLGLLCSLTTTAQSKKKPDPALCEAKFSVVTQDALKNVTRGLSDKDAKWFAKDIEKRYPDVCYVPPARDVPLVFFITVTPHVYHGAATDPSSMSNGNIIEPGSAQSSTALPYDVKYGIFTLTVETTDADGKWKELHQFQREDLHKTLLDIKGQGHPIRTVVEEAAKWIHEGGLKDPRFRPATRVVTS